MYEYRCGMPISGWEYVELEAARMEAMWNRLVEVEREYEREIDRFDRLPAMIGNEEVPESIRRYWGRNLPGMRRRLLLRRREMYRLFARRAATRYREIEVTTEPLAVRAYVDRGMPENRVRHRACAHYLISEIKNQGRKTGAAISVDEVPIDASARVPLRVRGRKNKTLREAVRAEQEALADGAVTA